MTRLQRHRQAALSAQCGRCIYCLRPLGSKATAEHLRARQDGGTDRRENIAAACSSCNHGRHADPTRACLTPWAYGFLVLLERQAGLRSVGHR
ncbi:HNH endonuclease [Pseudacidovorax intermedius]|uniref:HNH endonuclease n=1 Tax=Pseudacidovorax intermedius TaxID=433924 RepID=UPI0019D3E117